MGTGEKLDMIEPFHPDRMAQRILGMGDVLSFIERAEQSIDEEKAKKLEEKLKEPLHSLRLLRPARPAQEHGQL